MLKYISEYIKIWYGRYLWGITIPPLNIGDNDKLARRSTHELAKSANPNYRAKVGGTWELVAHTSWFGYPDRAFWVRKGYRAPSEGIWKREEYREGKLYKVQSRQVKHGDGGRKGNGMVTEYIK